MIWGSIYFKGTIYLAGVEGNMDSEYNCKVLKNGLLTVFQDEVGDIWTLQQDGASVQRSEYTKSGFLKTMCKFYSDQKIFADLNIT